MLPFCGELHISLFGFYYVSPFLGNYMGDLNYETLHLLHNEINSKKMVVHSNIRGGQHSHLNLVVSLTAYAILTNTIFVCQFHPGNLIIPIAATHYAQEELKFQYDENLQLFHKIQVVQKVLIQKPVLAPKARYTAATKNRTSGQFTETHFMLIQCLIATYGKIFPSQLIN